MNMTKVKIGNASWTDLVLSSPNSLYNAAC